MARALNLRAMHHAGEGRLDMAWADAVATHRFARLAANDPTIIGQLVAIAVDGVACSTTRIILQDPDLDKQLARRMLAELQELPALEGVADSLDGLERVLFVDLCVRIAQGKEQYSALSGRAGGGATPVDYLSRAKCDWNVVLRTGNQWYDRIASAARLPTRLERQQEFAQIDQELSVSAAKLKSPTAWLGGVVNLEKRSELMAAAMVELMMTIYTVPSRAEDRAETQLDLTIIAAALAVHRAKHGEYPEALEELVPEILTEQPLDLYSEAPFLYERKEDDGYLLYSVFENGKDDGGDYYTGEIVDGEWVDEPGVIDMEDSDLVIRVPAPPFRMPEPPPTDAELGADYEP